VIHLFKNSNEKINDELRTQEELPEKRTQLICVLAVPHYISFSDFNQFIGTYQKHISQMRILRKDDKSANHMVVIKFMNQKSADNFYLEFMENHILL